MHYQLCFYGKLSSKLACRVVLTVLRIAHKVISTLQELRMRDLVQDFMANTLLAVGASPAMVRVLHARHCLPYKVQRVLLRTS